MRNTARYTCVLFDLDSTLVDTDPLISEALELCGCEDVARVSRAELRTLSPYELLSRLSRPNEREAYWKHYKRLARTKMRLLDESTPRILGELEARGVRLGLVTSSTKPVTEAVLVRCGISQFFAECLVTYGTCGRRKPHPDPILTALRLLSHTADGAIYVGDAEKDALASRDAGVHFGLAAWAPEVDMGLADVGQGRVLNRISDLLDMA